MWDNDVDRFAFPDQNGLRISEPSRVQGVAPDHAAHGRGATFEGL